MAPRGRRTLRARRPISPTCGCTRATPRGWSGPRGRHLRRTGGTWTSSTTSTTATLRAVSGDGRQAFAVGDGGTVRRFANGVWVTVAAPTGETLRDVWSAAGLAGQVVIVGDFGTLLRWQGDGLTADNAAGGTNLFAVQVAASGRMVVVGDGLALERISSTWQELTVPYRTRFTALALSSSGESVDRWSAWSRHASRKQRRGVEYVEPDAGSARCLEHECQSRHRGG
jgi:hypothetical protein